MPEIPTTEPTTLNAGTSWAWDRTLSDYSPADGWTLSYAFRGPGSLDIGADEVTAVGDGFEVRVPASKTALPAGGYRWAAYATREDERHLVASGTVDVVADLAALQDGRTWAERQLEILEATYEEKAKIAERSWSQGRRSAENEELAALKRQIGLLRAEIAAERGEAFQSVEVRFGRS